MLQSHEQKDVVYRQVFYMKIINYIYLFISTQQRPLLLICIDPHHPIIAKLIKVSHLNYLFEIDNE